MKKIIQKILNSEPLNALEKAELENFDPEAASVKTASLQQQLDSVKQENTLLSGKLQSLQKERHLEKISRESGCCDPDYLLFKAEQQGIDTLDPEAMREFAHTLAKNSPGAFRASIVPGSSAGLCSDRTETNFPSDPLPGDRIGNIVLSINSAPDAV